MLGAGRAGSIAGLALSALGVGLLLRGAWLFWPRTVDDAFIVFRYADQVAAGNGAVFNVGERVEGYSSPIWLACSGLAVVCGLDPIRIAKGLGLFASTVLLFLVRRSLRRTGVSEMAAGLTTLALGASVVFQIWATAGLETNFHAMLLFAGLTSLAAARDSSTRGVLPASAWLAAAALTRPEGLAFWLLGGVWTMLTPSVARRSRLSAYVVGGLAPALHIAWRWLYYSDLLPNTYYVKTGGGLEMLRQGWHGFSLFASDPVHALWIAAATIGAWVGWVSGLRSTVILFAGAVIAQWTYIISVGDDGLRVHRFYVPALPLLVTLAGLAFAPAAVAVRGRRVAIAVVGAALLAASCLSVPGSSDQAVIALADAARAYQEGNERLGQRLASDRAPNTLIAVAAAGAIPYYSRLPAIDMYGLTDAHIARVAFPSSTRGRLMKWDTPYVLSRSPGVVVINRGYFRAGDPEAIRAASRPETMAASPMDRELFAQIAADDRYRLVPIRFEDGAVFYVFERVGR